MPFKEPRAGEPIKADASGNPGGEEFDASTQNLDEEALFELEGKVYDENGQLRDCYERDDKKEGGDVIIFYLNLTNS